MTAAETHFRKRQQALNVVQPVMTSWEFSDILVYADSGRYDVITSRLKSLHYKSLLAYDARIEYLKQCSRYKKWVSWKKLHDLRGEVAAASHTLRTWETFVRDHKREQLTR